MANSAKPTTSRGRGAFFVVTSLFFSWGFITVLVDGLIPRLRDVFELSYFQAGLVQFAFFTAYAVVSIPSGVLIARIGYKRGAVIGLITMAVGCLIFFPAASLRVYALFLLALFVLAGGITTLQVAANPYVALLGPPAGAASRLNLAQAFNSLGTAIAPLVAATFILGSEVLSSAEIQALSLQAQATYYAREAAAVQGPFLTLAIALLVVGFAFASFRLPNIVGADGAGDRGSYSTALRYPHLMLGAVAIFLYVGAEVAIGSYLVNFFLSLDVVAVVRGSPLMQRLVLALTGSDYSELNPSRLAGTFVFFYWSGAMVGRFIGAYLLRFVQSGRLLAIYGVVAMAVLAVTILSGGSLAMATVLSVGLFNSIMFPTIFTLALAHTSNNTAQASGILCAAIVGGAVVPPLMGAVGDRIGLQNAFLVPMACYLFIAYYGAAGYRVRGAGGIVAPGQVPASSGG